MVIVCYEMSHEYELKWQEAADTVAGTRFVSASTPDNIPVNEEGEDVLFVRGNVEPYQPSEGANYELPSPSPDQVVEPQSSLWFNPSSTWRQTETNHLVVYPRGYPMNRRKMESRNEWKPNTEDPKAGIWCFPTDPPDVDSFCLATIDVRCRDLFLHSPEDKGGQIARGVMLAKGKFMPMGRVLLVAAPLWFTFLEHFDGSPLGDVIAAYYVQKACHEQGRAVGFGLPILKRERPRNARLLADVVRELEDSPYTTIEALMRRLENEDGGSW